MFSEFCGLTPAATRWRGFAALGTMSSVFCGLTPVATRRRGFAAVGTMFSEFCGLTPAATRWRGFAAVGTMTQRLAFPAADHAAERRQQVATGVSLWNRS